ncbi:MAG: penicillin-binding protein 1C [Candidatus Eisenbacteria bacterium]
MIPRLARRALRLATIAGVTIAGVTCVALWLVPALTPLPPRWTEPIPSTLLTVTDREGRPLAELGRDDLACLPVALTAIDSTLIAATLAAEDRRFFHHPGIAPLAVARAAGQNLRAGHAVSGGSTLTQQLVKLLDRSYGPLSPTEKLRQLYWALVLEAHCTKRELLAEYLNRAPYGPTLSGVEAAARCYFDHAAAHLSLPEAALLAALPQSPARFDPRRHPEAAMAARNRVLDRMPLAHARREAAKEAPLGLASSPRAELPLAPHWAERVRVAYPTATVARLPIDRDLQSGVRDDLRGAISELRARGADDGAVVVIENQTNEVRAWVGSPDYRDPRHGQFDAVLARRQPGSALKPFEYALAFEQGLDPASLLPDLPLTFPGPDGSFTPGNYAGGWHGPVRARLALANSWNTPAVALLASLGPEALLARLRALGLSSLDQPASRYGLGLALGVGEVTLLELTEAYAVLARGGLARPRVDLLEVEDANGELLARRAPLSRAANADSTFGGRRVIERRAAFFVNSILSDPRARALAFGRGGPFERPFPCAIKTGTSSDWRDNWAFGYTARYTVGVWVGRAGGEDGSRFGTEGAILALRRVLLRLHDAHEIDDAPFPSVIAGVEEREICPLSGMAAGPDCPGAVREWCASDAPRGEPCLWHRTVTIDVANGLLARACTPNTRVAPTLFTLPTTESAVPRRIDPLARVTPIGFERWAREQGWPVPPAALTACVCGRADCGARDANTALFVREETGAKSSFALAAASLHRSAPRRAQAGTSERPCRILRPVEGAIYALDPSLPRAQQAIALEASAGPDPVRWSVDGDELGTAASGERVFWPLRAGRHRVRAERIAPGAGAAPARDEITIEVEGNP